jgi:hypothetical protein
MLRGELKLAKTLKEFSTYSDEDSVPAKSGPRGKDASG